MRIANRIFEIISYKNITCMLGICSTLLLLPMQAYSHSPLDYDGIGSIKERPYGLIVGGTSCSGIGQDPSAPPGELVLVPCWESIEGYQELVATSIASCNQAIQDRYSEANAKTVVARSCKETRIIEPGVQYTSQVSGAACHIDTVFVGGSTNFCQCPDGTSNVTNGSGQIVGCKDKPKAKPQCEECVGNPVNPATGNKYQIETDYSSSNLSTFLFRRMSSTESTYWEETRDPAQLAPMGKTWRHNYSAKIEPILSRPDGVTMLTDASVIRSDGRRLHFTLTNGVWVSDADVVEQLTSLYDINNNLIGWQLYTTDNQTELYDPEGKLLSITLLNGQAFTLEYDVAVVDGGDDDLNTLDSVTDPFERTLTFTNNNGRIATMTDPAGEIYTYAYDVNDNLISVTYPDETPADSNDNPQRIYHYEAINFPNHLSGITNENGVRFATWAFDTEGRAILSEHAGGVDRVELVYYNNIYTGVVTTTVTDSAGHVQTYHIQNHLGVRNVFQIDGGPCTSCGGQNLNKTYDANGFVASRTDFNGNITTFINDSRGLQISRTEAVGTAEERTITTEWHAIFRLPTKITEPGKITNFTYDPQGRLLERKEEIAP